MTDKVFAVLAVSGLPGVAGVLMAFFPRVMPRATNAYWAFFGMKSRLAESDYEKIGVRVTGVFFIVFAIYVLVMVGRIYGSEPQAVSY